MAEALHEEVFVEVQIGDQVDFIEEDDVRLFKGQGVFVGLVAAVGRSGVATDRTTWATAGAWTIATWAATQL